MNNNGRNTNMLLPDFIDDNLTPENAKENGYTYVDEVIYDREAPVEAMQDIIDMVEKEGFKLGTSARRDDPSPFSGLYVPLKNSQKSPSKP